MRSKIEAVIDWDYPLRRQVPDTADRQWLPSLRRVVVHVCVVDDCSVRQEPAV